ncbi:MAG TPA: hypothetical protein VJS92_12105, partial [Candidatus Polarisedimenticolaceae bacterium]|nr:hypothetical protein [Candidatus Polarisedimenticolaceae bacterium]
MWSAILAATLALAELGARLVRPWLADDRRYLTVFVERVLNSRVVPSRASAGHDDKLGHRLAPHAEYPFATAEYHVTAHTNALGFRGRDPGPRQEGEHRVLLLGDSMLFGIGSSDDETVAAQLERLGGFSVFDLSAPGYNTVHELVAAREFLPVFQPTQVIVGLFLGNDVVADLVATVDADGRYAVSPQRLDELERRCRRSLGPAWPSALARGLLLPALAP